MWNIISNNVRECDCSSNLFCNIIWSTCCFHFMKSYVNMKIMINLQKKIYLPFYLFVYLFLLIKCPFKEMFMWRIITADSGIFVIVYYVYLPIFEMVERDRWRLKKCKLDKKKTTTKSRLTHKRNFEFFILSSLSDLTICLEY